MFDPDVVTVDGAGAVDAVVVDVLVDEACDDELEQAAAATQHTIMRLAANPCLLNGIGTPISRIIAQTKLATNLRSFVVTAPAVPDVRDQLISAAEKLFASARDSRWVDGAINRPVEPGNVSAPPPGQVANCDGLVQAVHDKRRRATEPQRHRLVDRLETTGTETLGRLSSCRSPRSRPTRTADARTSTSQASGLRTRERSMSSLHDHLDRMRRWHALLHARWPATEPKVMWSPFARDSARVRRARTPGEGTFPPRRSTVHPSSDRPGHRGACRLAVARTERLIRARRPMASASPRLGPTRRVECSDSATRSRCAHPSLTVPLDACPTH